MHGSAAGRVVDPAASEAARPGAWHRASGRAAGRTRNLAEMTPNERFFLGLKMAVLKTGYLPAHLLGGNLAMVGVVEKIVHLDASQPDSVFFLPLHRYWAFWPFWCGSHLKPPSTESGGRCGIDGGG